ncbi:hypothetical protein B296_00045012, partial [Ensete ventricosum]
KTLASGLTLKLRRHQLACCLVRHRLLLGLLLFEQIRPARDPERMARYQVDGKVVQGVDLLKRRHWAWRLDVWPFAILYSIWLFAVAPSIDFTDALIVLGGLALLHILVLLFTAWSVDFRCFVQFSKNKREKKKREKKNLEWSPMLLFAHAICRRWAKNRLRDSSPVGDFFSPRG